MTARPDLGRGGQDTETWLCWVGAHTSGAGSSSRENQELGLKKEVQMEPW